MLVGRKRRAIFCSNGVFGDDLRRPDESLLVGVLCVLQLLETGLHTLQYMNQEEEEEVVEVVGEEVEVMEDEVEEEEAVLGVEGG